MCRYYTNPDFQATNALDPRWKLFQSVLLEKHHRQGQDGNYADILNRVRTGDQTEEDLEEFGTNTHRKYVHELTHLPRDPKCKVCRAKMHRKRSISEVNRATRGMSSLKRKVETTENISTLLRNTLKHG